MSFTLTSLQQYRAAVQQRWMPAGPFNQCSAFLVSLSLHYLALIHLPEQPGLCLGSFLSTSSTDVTGPKHSLCHFGALGYE